MFKRLIAFVRTVFNSILRKGEKAFSIERLESEVDNCTHKLKEMSNQMDEHSAEIAITVEKDETLTHLIKTMTYQLKMARERGKDELAIDIFNRIKRETETKAIYTKTKADLTDSLEKLKKVYKAIEKRVDKLKHEVHCAKMRKNIAKLSEGAVTCIENIQGDGTIEGVDGILEDIRRDEIKADIKIERLTDSTTFEDEMASEASIDDIDAFLNEVE